MSDERSERFSLEAVAELRGRVDVHEDKLRYQAGELKRHDSEVSTLGQGAALHAQLIHDLDRRVNQHDTVFVEIKDVLHRVGVSLDTQSETNLRLITAVTGLEVRHEKGLRAAYEKDANLQQEIVKDRAIGWKAVAVAIVALALLAWEKLF